MCHALAGTQTTGDRAPQPLCPAVVVNFQVISANKEAFMFFVVHASKNPTNKQHRAQVQCYRCTAPAAV